MSLLFNCFCSAVKDDLLAFRAFVAQPYPSARRYRIGARGFPSAAEHLAPLLVLFNIQKEYLYGANGFSSGYCPLKFIDYLAGILFGVSSPGPANLFCANSHEFNRSEWPVVARRLASSDLAIWSWVSYLTG